MRILVERCLPTASMPEAKSDGAAGYDIAVAIPATVAPGDAILLRTGLKLAIPTGHVGLIFERSSFNRNTGCSLANKVGVIDSDYRGEVLLAVRNNTSNPVGFPTGQRVAQLVVVPCVSPQFEEGQIGDTVRGSDGFGSTGSV